MFGVDLKEDELFFGEKIILSKNANSVINVKEYGLGEIPMLFRNALGFSQKEAIGGKLYLTNYRFIFKSHSLNRLTGKFSIFLSTIQGIKDKSVLIMKKMDIDTEVQNYEFVVWGIGEIMQKAEEAKSNLTLENLIELKEQIVQNGDKSGVGLNYCKFMDFLVQKTDYIVQNIATITKDPFSMSTVVNIADLIQKIDNWEGRSFTETDK